MRNHPNGEEVVTPFWLIKKAPLQFSAQLRKRDLRHVIWQKLDNFDNRIIEPDLTARGSHSGIIQHLHQLLFQPVVVRNVFKLALFEPGKCLKNTQCAQYPLENCYYKIPKMRPKLWSREPGLQLAPVSLSPFIRQSERSSSRGYSFSQLQFLLGASWCKVLL